MADAADGRSPAASALELEQPDGVPASAPLSDEAQKAAVAKVWRNLMPVMYVSALLSYLDRSNLSYAALELNEDLGFTPKVYGLGAGLFFCSYTLFELPSNMLLARFGAPRWLSRILVSWGLVACAFAAMTGARGFYTLRLLLGAAEAGFYPGASQYLTSWFTGEEFGQAYAIITLGSCSSGIFGGLLALLFMALDGAMGMAGWQWLFLAEGLPTIALGIAYPRLVPAGPRAAKWLTPPEAGWLAARATAAAREKPGHGSHGATSASAMLAAALASLRNWRVWYLGGIHCCGLCAYYGILFWSPLLIRGMVDGDARTRAERREVDPRVIGLSMIPYIAAAAALTANAEHSRRTREVRWHAAVPMACGALGLACLGPLAKAGRRGAAMLALVIANAGAWADHGPRATMWEGVAAGQQQAAAFAIINSLGNVGGFVGSYVMGALQRPGDNTTGTLVLACLMGLAATMTALYPAPPTQGAAKLQRSPSALRGAGGSADALLRLGAGWGGDGDGGGAKLRGGGFVRLGDDEGGAGGRGEVED